MTKGVSKIVEEAAPLDEAATFSKCKPLEEFELNSKVSNPTIDAQ